MNVTVVAGMIVGLCALVPSAYAAPILDESQENANSFPGGFPSGQNWNYQTVSPDQDFLTSVEFFIRVENGARDVTVDVFGNNSDNAENFTNLLGSVTAEDLVTGGGTWVPFVFTSPIDISSYTKSAGAGRVLLRVGADSDPGGAEYVAFQTGNPYADGLARSSLTAGVSWQNPTGGAGTSTDDLRFRVFTDSVPEPSSIVLTALGACVLLGRRKRRYQALARTWSSSIDSTPR